ncbi:MAG: sodium:solute symporter family transporter, partial [Rubrivivax sp.]
MRVTPLDYLIAGAYLLGMLLMAARLARRQRSDKDYFVGGRNLPWWALGLSTLATQSSANSFIGIPAFVALVPGGGLVWLQYEIALPLALAVVALVLVPVFRGLGLISVFEYLELRFDRSTRQWLSAVFLLSRGLATAGALYATALVVSVLTGWSLTTSVLVAGGVTVAYDLMGGMRAVVWSDVLQMALILVGLVLCIGYAVTLAGGWQAVVMAVEPDRLAAVSLGHGLGDGDRAPLWGFVIGGFVLYVAYYGVDQTQVQRQLSARSVADAQRVLVANAMLRFPLTALYAVLGLALAAALLQSPALRQAVPADRPDLLVPRFIELHLPMGLRGLLLVSLLAAAMSSLDSALNNLAAATLEDFVQKPGSPARRSLRQPVLDRLHPAREQLTTPQLGPRIGAGARPFDPTGGPLGRGHSPLGL